MLYQLNGVLPADKYVPGQYRWPVPVQITTALLDCHPPSAGVLSVILEIGGVLKAFRFTVAAGSDSVSLSQTVNVLVPANTDIRWRASFTGAPEEAATQLSVMMQVVEQSVSQVAAIRPKLTLQWVNQRETLVLFNYDSASHTFTEATPGISAGRATVVRSGDTQTSLFIGAAEVLRVQTSAAQASAWFAVGGTASSLSPRILFCVDNAPIATADAAGFRVVDLVEDTPPALGPTDDGYYSRFEFYSDGMLTAALAATGLTALGLGELA